MSLPKTIILLAAAAMPLGACQKADVAARPDANAAEASANTAAAHPSDPIESAMAAAPAAIGKDATIILAKGDGTMETLRAGSNGWTCMPNNPETPGSDPMC